jgi:hypothetical protein
MGRAKPGECIVRFFDDSSMCVARQPRASQRASTSPASLTHAAPRGRVRGACSEPVKARDLVLFRADAEPYMTFQRENTAAFEADAGVRTAKRFLATAVLPAGFKWPNWDDSVGMGVEERATASGGSARVWHARPASSLTAVLLMRERWVRHSGRHSARRRHRRPRPPPRPLPQSLQQQRRQDRAGGRDEPRRQWKHARRSAWTRRRFSSA